MKKLSIMFTFMLTLLLSACTSSLFDKTVEAYEESTKELANATSDEDCDRIHDELMDKLYNITQEYPDWEDIIKKEGENSAAVQKVTDAYKAWNEALKKVASSDHYMFMTYCNFPNAIKQKEGNTSTTESSESDDSNDETTEETSTSASDSDIDAMLDSYEEYVNKLSDFYDKLKELEPGSSEYLELMGEAQELGDSYNDLVEKCNKSTADFSSEQMERYTEITKKLSEVMQKKL